ncbi:MAG: pantoate--beta-alanine ligase [Pseudomonadota bacterium]
MKVFQSKEELRYEIKHWRGEGQTIALVPTMGNLHAGHLSLVELASQVADKVVVSIFVNPLQFAENEDLATYPRTPEADVAKLVEKNVDAVFLPQLEAIYPQDRNVQTQIYVPQLSEDLCGISRPGFFTGVATIVAKLFNIIQPDKAVFGEKDYQQLLIIRQLVSDMNYSIDIVSGPTVREADGLALSSRNQYLSKQQRQLAPKLFATLNRITQQCQAQSNFEQLEYVGNQELTKLGFQVDYLTIRRQSDLQVPVAMDRALMVLTACYLGKTRLIDNQKCYLTHCSN